VSGGARADRISALGRSRTVRDLIKDPESEPKRGSLHSSVPPRACLSMRRLRLRAGPQPERRAELATSAHVSGGRKSTQEPRQTVRQRAARLNFRTSTRSAAMGALASDRRYLTIDDRSRARAAGRRRGVKIGVVRSTQEGQASRGFKRRCGHYGHTDRAQRDHHVASPGVSRNQPMASGP
jgi:hypothetical protein